MDTIPAVLFRGIKLQPDSTADQLVTAVTSDLVPGSRRLDDQGRETVSSGDERGVYMISSAGGCRILRRRG